MGKLAIAENIKFETLNRQYRMWSEDVARSSFVI
jgi:hypothetical protein